MTIPAVQRLLAMGRRLSDAAAVLGAPQVLGVLALPPAWARATVDPLDALATVLPPPQGGETPDEAAEPSRDRAAHGGPEQQATSADVPASTVTPQPLEDRRAAGAIAPAPQIPLGRRVPAADVVATRTIRARPAHPAPAPAPRVSPPRRRIVATAAVPARPRPSAPPPAGDWPIVPTRSEPPVVGAPAAAATPGPATPPEFIPDATVLPAPEPEAPAAGGRLRLVTDTAAAASVLRAQVHHSAVSADPGPMPSSGAPVPPSGLPPPVAVAPPVSMLGPWPPGGTAPVAADVSSTAVSTAGIDAVLDALTERVRLELLRSYGTTEA